MNQWSSQQTYNYDRDNVCFPPGLLYRTVLLGIFVSERFLLVNVLDLEESKGAERWEQSQN
jgi:hypothetical protein